MTHPRTRVITNAQLTRAGVVAILLGLALVVVGINGTGRQVAQASTTDPPADPIPTEDPAASSDTVQEAFDTSTVSPKRPTPTVTVTAPSEATAQSAVPVSVAITGAKASGEILVLEQLQDDKSWKALSSTRVDTHNTAALTITQQQPATYGYRVWLASTTQHKEVTSEFTMTVVAPTPEPGTDSLTELPSTTSAAQPTTTSSSLCGPDAPKRPDGSAWVCSYDDEFEGTALDRRYWIAQQSKNSGFVTGSPTAPACVIDDPQTISVAGGLLSLRAKQLDQPVTCGTTISKQVSGMVMQLGTFAQAYGKWEVRAKVPTWAGKGYQETFWLWPVDQLKYGPRHPASGEIDFAEFYSNYSYLTVPFMHYLFDPNTVSFATNTNIYTAHNCLIKVGEFNTYGLEWTPGLLRIFINGKVCITNNYLATNAPEGSPYAPFDSPFFLALTQAFGTTGNELDPAASPAEVSTDVDYVHVWR